ncbi:MAG: hypothetical protein JO284_13315 [Planctomycetaceae bacterium]|nr:hypothetical protein [Planctomycetaceae bacterium]
MRFTVDVGELAVVPELDTEPAAVDLTRAGLGDACLDAAVAGMLESHGAQRAADGTPWAPLKAATVRRKGHATIGVQSGIFLDPRRWRMAPRKITPRVAVWFYPTTRPTGDGCDGHARAFHAGHPRTGSPARPIFGWTLGAQETCRRLVAAAARAATAPRR